MQDGADNVPRQVARSLIDMPTAVSCQPPPKQQFAVHCQPVAMHGLLQTAWHACGLHSALSIKPARRTCACRSSCMSCCSAGSSASRMSGWKNDSYMRKTSSDVSFMPCLHGRLATRSNDGAQSGWKNGVHIRR